MALATIWQLRIFARTLTDTPPGRNRVPRTGIRMVMLGQTLRAVDAEARGFEFEDAGQSAGKVVDMDPRNQLQDNPLGRRDA